MIMTNEIGQTKIYYPGNADTEKRQKELDRSNLVHAVLTKLEDIIIENDLRYARGEEENSGSLTAMMELLKTVKNKDLEKFLKGK
tara:strand:- start:1201 stop:1455 length:255 start_codon:yes stop_codon:yes gene_type:complete